MGTRSLTIVVDGMYDNAEIAVLYRQMDGYPEGHGKELATFLKDFHIVNGMRLDDTRKIANGAGCLFAQLVAHFKDGPGGFYLHPAGCRNCLEDYIYTIYANAEEPLRIEVVDTWKRRQLFRGTPQEMLEWLSGL
jgi:hypothetical protein